MGRKGKVDTRRKPILQLDENKKSGGEYSIHMPYSINSNLLCDTLERSVRVHGSYASIIVRTQHKRSSQWQECVDKIRMFRFLALLSHFVLSKSKQEESP